MIRLGVRLTLGSGREAQARVLVLAAAVALGVGLLLTVLGAMHGLQAQAERGAWLDTSAQTPAPNPPQRTARLWWRLEVDQYRGQTIDRVDVAATGRGAPVPPGVAHLPGPGQYVASPALAGLLRTVPADQLADRFPGRLVGTLGPAALPSPDSLIAVVGRTPGQLAHAPGTVEVRGIQQSLADCYTCRSGVGSGPVLRWVLVGGAVALLLPVLILIATASRLSATRREERFAAMRLVGATPRQISVLAAVEATVASVAGVAVGFALYFAWRPVLAHVPFTGTPLASDDLSLSGPGALLVAVGVPVSAVVSALAALRRVQASPLGVRRRARSAPPRAVRVLPLAAGIALLAYFDAAGKPGANNGQLLELLVGFVLLVVGLVLAGPWFTTAGSRLLATRARRPAALIAGRRLLDNPRAAFRFVSGLVLALFVTTAAVGALSSVTAAAAGTGAVGPGGGTATLADLFCNFGSSDCPAGAVVHSVPAGVLRRLGRTAGVRGVAVLHSGPTLNPGSNAYGLVDCSQLARTPAIGRCARGASVADVGWFLEDILGADPHASTTVWPPARLAAAGLARLPLDGVVVATDGTPGAVERARTALERAFPLQGTSVVVESVDPGTARLLAMIQDLTEVVVVASLVIAACSLAVNVAAGLGERKRPFSLLRLSGVPTAVLHRVVALESALPLLMVAAVAIAVGLTAAALYLSSQVGIAFHLPGTGYWATVGAGLAASLAVIAATFPLLDRSTGPEVARND